MQVHVDAYVNDSQTHTHTNRLLVRDTMICKRCSHCAGFVGQVGHPERTMHIYKHNTCVFSSLDIELRTETILSEIVFFFHPQGSSLLVSPSPPKFSEKQRIYHAYYTNSCKVAIEPTPTIALGSLFVFASAGAAGNIDPAAASKFAWCDVSVSTKP